MKQETFNIWKWGSSTTSYRCREASLYNCVSVTRTLLGVLLAFLCLPTVITAATDNYVNTSTDTPARDLRVVGVGKPIQAKLAGGESHVYKLNLKVNQYLDLLVNQKGIDVVVILISPDNKEILRIDSPNGSEGAEHLLTVALSSGTYRVEIKALEKATSAGEYTLAISELRQATANDFKRSRAYAAYIAGKTLALEGSYGGPAHLLREALKKYEEALDLYRAIGDHSQEAQILFFIGDVWRNLDENQKAIDYYLEALPAIKVLSDPQLEGAVLSRLGSAYSDLGENQKALQYSLQALPLIKQSGDRNREAAALYGVGTIYYSVGSTQRSLECFAEALGIARQLNNKYIEAYTLQRLGVLYRDLGENQKALHNLEQGLRLSEELLDRRGQAWSLSEIGRLYALLGQTDKAIGAFNKALLLSRDAAMRGVEARTLNNLGTTYASLGKNQEALEAFRHSLEQGRMIGDPRIEVEALFGIAKVERAKGGLNNSRQAIEFAIPIVDSIRTKIGRPDIRLEYFASVQRIYDFYVDLLMQMHFEQPLKGFDTLAFQANEGFRARNLLEMLTASNVDIRESVDPSLLERERTLQQAVNATALRRMGMIGTTDNDQTSSLSKSLERLVSQYEDVEAEIRLKSPRYAALRDPRPLTLADIQKRVLDNDTLLLEYALGEDRSFLWAVSRDSIHSYELPKRAVIEADTQNLFRMLNSRSPSLSQSRTEQEKTSYWNVASRLSAVLLGPVARDLGRKRLLVVGQGVLQVLPFGALPVPRGSGESEHNQPLIVEHEIVYAPSASIVETLRRETKDRKPAPKAIAVFADPVFQRNDPRLGTTKVSHKMNRSRPANDLQPSPFATTDTNDADVTGFYLTRLLHTRSESQNIVSLVPRSQSMAALDFAANRQTAISGELSQYRIIHFATHAFIDNSHPELSGVVLSLLDERGNPQDGFLRVNEIFNLKLSADLVVLSGCSTGLGTEVKGEGIVGLTRAFMYAGTPSVIVSLWNTDDRSTATLMTRFYSSMVRDGLKPSAALRAAQIEMWRDKGWHEPYNWAAFVLQGDWQFTP